MRLSKTESRVGISFAPLIENNGTCARWTRLPDSISMALQKITDSSFRFFLFKKTLEKPISLKIFPQTLYRTLLQ